MLIKLSVWVFLDGNGNEKYYIVIVGLKCSLQFMIENKFMSNVL